MFRRSCFLLLFFFNDTATTEIYTLSLHDALPISVCFPWRSARRWCFSAPRSSRSTSGSGRRKARSEEHTSELQSPDHLVCRLLLEKKKRHPLFSQAHRHRLHPGSLNLLRLSHVTR